MNAAAHRSKRKLTHEQRILLLALLAGLPGTLVALALLWAGGYPARVDWTLAGLVVILWLGVAFGLRERVVHPLQTLSNLLGALREGDFSIRARGARPEDALGEVMLEVNALGDTLREQRLGALEATALLKAVMAEMDVAVFAFDGDQCLRLVNRAGERLLAKPFERLLGRRADEIGLGDCLEGEPTESSARSDRIVKTFPGAPAGRTQWGISRSVSRQGGVALRLLALSDLSRHLREEEGKAWQRLIRVLGHELNNSLAPIISMAGSLDKLLAREPFPDDWKEDMQRGLRVIGARAESLSRFMEAYARLARLPQPQLSAVDVETLIRQATSLETRLMVALVPGPRLSVQADAVQLEQALINLLRNAVDASLETGGGVRIGWNAPANAGRNATHLVVWIEDEGPGLSGTANLFVPFYTTKPGGTGIGLVLSRQIAEAHGGSLSLENRSPERGCSARLSLPLDARGR